MPPPGEGAPRAAYSTVPLQSNPGCAHLSCALGLGAISFSFACMLYVYIYDQARRHLKLKTYFI
jgi:hypothetical protein